MQRNYLEPLLHFRKGISLQEDNKIVNGTIWKEVILFFIPITIGAFFQHFYAIVDTIIVGKVLGTMELSAVGGSASKIIVLLINFFVGVSCGITALSSQYFGKKDKDKLHAVVYNGTILFTIVSMILSAIGMRYADELLLLMKTPIETLEIAQLYLKTYLGGIIFCVLYNLFSGILRALGDSKKPLYVLMFCSVLNILLDIVFAVILKKGVFGIAFATLLSQAISALILMKLVHKALPDINLQKCSIDKGIIKGICAIGIPAGLQSIMFSVSNIVVQSGVNTFGALSVASWSAYVKIDSIVDIFLSSLGSTVITFVGQNFGAKRIDRVKACVKQIMIISYVLVGALVGIFILLRVPLISMFTEDKAVVSMGSQILCVILPMYLLAIPQQIYSQALRGLGESFIPMILTLLGVIAVRLIWVILLLPMHPTISFLGLCYPFSALLMSLIFTCYYKVRIKKCTI